MKNDMHKKLDKNNIQDIFELNKIQKGILFHYVEDSGSNYYNVQISLEIKGRFDLKIFTEAFKEIQLRNEALRSVFRWESASKPLQIVLKDCPLNIKIKDISKRSNQEFLIKDITSRDKIERFNLEELPIRITIIKLNDKEVILNITHHHILYDGWSSSILIEELFYCYNKICKQESIDFSKPKYCNDFGSKLIGNEDEFWRKYLENYKVRSLFGSTFDKTGETPKRKRFSCEFEDLKKFSTENKVTHASFINTAFGILIQKYFYVDDIVFGTTVSNRDSSKKGSNRLIGNYINTIPFRIKTQNDDIIIEKIKRVNKELITRNQFTNTSYHEIKQLLKLKREEELFDIILVVENYPINFNSLINKDFSISLRSVYENTGIPLGVNVYLWDDMLEFDIVFYNDIISEESITRIGKYFINIIETLINNPLKEIGSIQIPIEEDTNANEGHLAKIEKKNNCFPASIHQERLWFINEFERGYLYEGNPIYHNIPLSFDINGNLNIEQLERSIQYIVEKYDILKVRIITREQKPYQEILRDYKIKLLVETIEPDLFNDEVLVLNQVNKPFSNEEPLIRVKLFITENRKAKLVFVFHHSIMDYYSVKMISREIIGVYEALSSANAIDCNQDTLDYIDFSLWQQEFLLNNKYRVLAYWKHKLHGKVKALEIPLDHPRAAVHIYKPGQTNFQFDKNLNHLVLDFENRTGVSVNIILLTAFKVLLFKYVQHEEIVVGTSYNNRNSDKLKNLIGPVANLVVLRSFIQDNKTFSNLLSEIHACYSDAMVHGAMPFDKLVTELAPEKDMSRTALFDVLYLFEKEEETVYNSNQLKVVINKTNLGYGKYDLNILFKQVNSIISGNLVFNAEYFDDQTIDAFVRHFCELTEKLVKNPNLQIGNIENLSEKEQNRIIDHLDNRNVKFPQDLNIIDLFKNQVENHPGKIAIQFGNEEITYLELDNRSNQLANALIEKGVRAENIVGILLDRNIDTIVSIFGILKSAAAYLPMDIEYPNDRISYMLENSNAKVIVTSSQYKEVLNYPQDIIFVEDLSKYSVENVTVDIGSNNLCYLIYTSGTTGRPKGVMVEHKNVVRLLFNEAFQFSFTDKDVWTMFHSHCFDFSVWEIFGSLLNGSKLIIIPKIIAKDTASFLRILAKENVTVLNQTPSAFYNLLWFDENEYFNRLNIRYIIFGGEALTPSKLKKWRTKYPNTRLINMYGITETTVHVTYKEISGRDIENNISNIGKPIPTLSILILDQNKKVVPCGVVGEMYVGGDGVTRGYFGNRTLTEEKFVQNPVSGDGIVYKTGDLARLLNTGEIEYIGRIDNQVQLRGFRIELGEIENQIESHTKISDSIVLLKERNGNRYLVAYYVSEEKLNDEDIRNFLLEKLPDYMVPSFYLHLFSIPLTTNGKKDRGKLPEPSFEFDDITIGASNKIEEKLVEIWSEILSIEEVKISTTSSFFEIGGHSLNSTTLINRILREFHVDIPFRELLKNQNIKKLAEIIQSSSKVTKFSLKNAPEQEYYPLTSAQKRLFFLNKFDKDSLVYNMPLTIRLKGNLNILKLKNAFEKLITRHEILRTGIEVKNNIPVQQVQSDIKFTIEYLTYSDKKIDQAIDDFIRPFDLSVPPLLRVGIIKENNQQNILIIDIHHIINDGVSSSIIFNELTALYSDIELPKPQFQFKDFAYFQQSVEYKYISEKHKEFWLKEFSEIPEAIELPIDNPRPSVRKYTGDSLKLIINKELTFLIRKAANREDITLFTFLLSAYYVLLNKITDQDDIVIGVTVAGRQQEGMEKVLGMFVDTLPVRNLINKEMTFKQFLCQVNDKALNCFENQNYQFENLINELDIERDTSRNPLFDVVFVSQNFNEESFNLPNLETEIYKSGHNVSKFDLTLYLKEQADKLTINFEYSTELFSKEKVQKITKNFLTLLHTIVEDIEIKIVDLRILPDQQNPILQEEYNNTTCDYSTKNTLVSVFKEQVGLNPGRIAIRYKKETTTYRELDRQSDQICCLLQEYFGVQRGDLVGVMLDRELYLIPAIYGVLKAGGAYIPIDPNYSEEQILTIIKDSELKVLVSCDKHLKFPIKKATSTLNLDTVSRIIEEEENIPKATGLSGRDLAYVIYTSGTTDKPEGVMIEHHSVINWISCMQKNYPLGSDDVMLQKTPIVSDVSVGELFWWSFAGSSLALLTPEEEMNATEIVNAIEQCKVSALHFVPSKLNELLEILKEGRDYDKMQSIRYVFTSRGALKPDHVNRFRATLFSHVKSRLISLYGPTEATVDVSCYECNMKDSTSYVPIGKPIDNINLFIVDKQNRLLPHGMKGELCISGIGLGRGYLNNVELTHGKFISAKFSQGTRVYKTGDIARWLPDGNIDYLGRIHDQVKIKGFRVELGEIEGSMISYNGIKDAVVIVKGNSSKYLVAYYTAEKKISNDVLKAHLSSTMQEYMIPKYFQHMEKFPITSNGRLDIKALPEPEIISKKEITQPRNKEEILLQNIWKVVLGIETISVKDNFFSLGGDSIKSIQISSRLLALGYDLQVKDIFMNPTIESLSKKIKKAEHKIEQQKIEGSAPLSPIQRWFFDGDIDSKSHFNQSVIINFPEGISKDYVLQIFEKIQEHHDALRMVFKNKNGSIMQQYKGYDLPVFIKEYDLIKEKNAKEILLLKCNQLQSGIDLANGPLMKLGLFHMNDGSRLLIIIHHLVVDGVSWRILFEDIESLYQQKKQDKPFVLPLKTSSYQFWSNNLLEYTKSKSYQIAKEYWKSFSDIEPILIQRDNPEGSNTFKDIATEYFHLSKDATLKLLTWAHVPFRTQINDILLATLLISIHNKFGHNKLLIDFEGHGREDMLEKVNVSRTIGWFTSIYPLFLKKDDNSLSEIIKKVKEMLRKVPNNGADYLIQKYLDPGNCAPDETSEHHSQICFNYLGQFDSDTKGNSYLITDEAKGDQVSLTTKRHYDWDVSGIITDKVLHISLTYSNKQYNKKTITSFVKLYRESLIDVINYCCEYKKVELTPSDLTYNKLTIAQLDELQLKYELKDVYPLSPMQEGMLFHSILDPESDHYFVQIIYQLEGQLDIGAIEQSIDLLFKRHDNLRTIFLQEGFERPMQVVLKERGVDFKFLDVRKLCQQNSKEEILKKYQKEDRAKKFDLSKDILLRLTVLETVDNEYEFIWSFHHILMDGWCVSIILNEFSKIYLKSKSGQKITLPVAKPYSEYIKWIEEKEKESSENYWMNYLNGYDSLSTIPKKITSSNNNSIYSLKSCSLTISKKQTELLRNISGKHEITLNTLFQCAWGILLTRYNNVEDVVFGAVVSGRPAEVEEIEKMIGLFINTVPVRIKYKSEDTISELLVKIQNNALESEPYHYSPLFEIQSLTELGRNLLDHVIAFENYPIANEINGYRHLGNSQEEYVISNVRFFEHTHYDFSLLIIPGEDIQIRIDYNETKYEKKEIESTLNHLEIILNQIISDINIKVSDIEVITDEEKHLLSNFNSTETPYSKDKNVISLFEKQVRKAPQNVAIEFTDKKVSYIQLNNRANAIASKLNSKINVKGNYKIALLFPPSIELISSILGAVKIGCSYVPLSPDVPLSRNKYIFSNSRAEALLVQKKLFEENPDIASITEEQRIILIDEESEELVSKNPLREESTDDLLYVIYTSGTTGNPKGVEINNLGILNMLHFYKELFKVEDGMNMSMVANISFDASAFEMWPSLIFGGCLHIAPVHLKHDPEHMKTWLIEKKIEITFQPTAIAEYLLKMDWGVGESCLKIVNVAGDKLNYQPSKALPFKLYNLYGPTEDSIWTTWFEVKYPQVNDIYRIGRPIANKKIYIINRDNKMQPIGIAGELCISGDGLAKGYCANKVLTEQKFLNSPFQTGQKIYKTGDRARWLSDGTLEFLGRIDDQVKIRGNRIELGEIEQQLLKHPQIKETAVIAKEKEDSKYLISYYTTHKNKEIEIDALKKYLQGNLPDYMVPTNFIWMENLPLTSNGKLDRKALFNQEIEIVEFMPATSDIEGKLVDIWSDVLNIEKDKISIQSNFFELGGHSLNIVTLNRMINEEFQSNISIANMFGLPTIKSIGDYILQGDTEVERMSNKIDEDLSEANDTLSLIEDNLG